jgi:dTDP-glucose 4,6-dehydratase
MRLIVTGGCGFIGSHFIRTVLKERPDWHVTNLDALTYAGNLATTRDFATHANYDFVHGSITDKPLVMRLAALADAVVHFAAETHVDRSIMDADPFIQTNIIGTQNLIDACRKYGIRLHHVSTDEVFGSLEDDSSMFHEATPYDPRNPYSATKAAADHLVRAAMHVHGLKATISNCTNNYGPYLYPEKFFAVAITNVLENKPIIIHGDGLQKRDWIHAADHARGVLDILERGKIGETYLMGGDTDINIADTARLILRLMDASDSKLVFMSDRPGQDRRYAIDFSKMTRELGWRPAYDLENGLTEMIAWYKDNHDWWRPIKESAGYHSWHAHQRDVARNQV